MITKIRSPAFDKDTLDNSRNVGGTVYDYI